MRETLKDVIIVALLAAAMLLIALIPELSRAEGEVIDPIASPTKTLTCTAPKVREDGTPLSIGELNRIYFYTSQDPAGPWVQIANRRPDNCKLSLDFTDLVDGQYYYMARSEDTDGLMSKDSNLRPLELRRPKSPPAPISDLN